VSSSSQQRNGVIVRCTPDWSGRQLSSVEGCLTGQDWQRRRLGAGALAAAAARNRQASCDDRQPSTDDALAVAGAIVQSVQTTCISAAQYLLEPRTFNSRHIQRLTELSSISIQHNALQLVHRHLRIG